MLGADAFALAACDTVGRLAVTVSCNESVVEELRTHVAGELTLCVDRADDIRNADAHRAAVNAVSACCTANLLNSEHRFNNLIDRSLLFIRERLEILEGIHVVFHLFLSGHAAQDSSNSGKASDKTEGP